MCNILSLKLLHIMSNILLLTLPSFTVIIVDVAVLTHSSCIKFAMWAIPRLLSSPIFVVTIITHSFCIVVFVIMSTLVFLLSKYQKSLQPIVPTGWLQGTLFWQRCCGYLYGWLRWMETRWQVFKLKLNKLIKDQLLLIYRQGHIGSQLRSSLVLNLKAIKKLFRIWVLFDLRCKLSGNVVFFWFH